EHPELRSEVRRRGEGQARRARPLAQGRGARVRRRALLLRLRRRGGLIMPKPTKGPRLGGGPAHERLLLGNLASQLFEHRSITTTEAKAKRVRPLAERLVTFAKRGDLHARRRVMRTIGDKTVVHQLCTEIAPRVADRPGGYTRITKTGFRKGDNAPMAVIELALEPVTPKRSGRSTAATAAPAAAAPAAPAAEPEATTAA